MGKILLNLMKNIITCSFSPRVVGEKWESLLKVTVQEHTFIRWLRFNHWIIECFHSLHNLPLQQENTGTITTDYSWTSLWLEFLEKPKEKWGNKTKDTRGNWSLWHIQLQQMLKTAQFLDRLKLKLILKSSLTQFLLSYTSCQLEKKNTRYTGRQEKNIFWRGKASLRTDSYPTEMQEMLVLQEKENDIGHKLKST